MKKDKAQLIQAIEAIRAKLAVMEEELNKPDEIKHFPREGDIYYYYTSSGGISSNTSLNDDLRVDAYRTYYEAEEAYNKAVALEKIKRRLLELQGDWKPDFNDYSRKYTICYNYMVNSLTSEEWQRFKHCLLIPYMKDKKIALAIIDEFYEELKLIFDIA